MHVLRLAGHLAERDLGPVALDERVPARQVDPRAFAAAAHADERGRDRKRGIGATELVAPTGVRPPEPGFAVHVDERDGVRQRVHVEPVRRQRGHRPGLAEARDRAHDQLRALLPKHGEVDAQRLP